MVGVLFPPLTTTVAYRSGWPSSSLTLPDNIAFEALVFCPNETMGATVRNRADRISNNLYLLVNRIDWF
ncbi:hypothetical protein D3C86_2257460 [compost metagenome]